MSIGWYKSRYERSWYTITRRAEGRSLLYFPRDNISQCSHYNWPCMTSARETAVRKSYHVLSGKQD